MLFLKAELCHFSNEAAQKCQDFEKQVSKNRGRESHGKPGTIFEAAFWNRRAEEDCLRKRGRRVYESLQVEEQNELELAIDHTYEFRKNISCDLATKAKK